MISSLVLSALTTFGSLADDPAILRTKLSPAISGVPESAIDDGWLKIRTTAYTHTESDHIQYGRKTAAGTLLRYGKLRSAAADWSRFPLGTRIQIEGEDCVYVVEDYGSALVGRNTIDLYRPTRSSMNQWGARHVRIRILEWGCFQRSHDIMKERTHNKSVRKMVKSIEKSRTTIAHIVEKLL